MESIGFLETNSIAAGVRAADAAEKAADVRLIFARPNCPGKFNILFHGDVSAVDSAVEAGAEAADTFLIEKLVIAAIDQQVVRALWMTSVPVERNALGVMEYFNITSAVLGADAAVKAAQVHIMDIRLGTGLGGKSFVTLTGEIASVNQAVTCGIEAAAANGTLLAYTVIPHPTPAVFESLL